MSIKDTVASFKEILEGKADDLPEQAFFLAGTLDDVRENAAKLNALMAVISRPGFRRAASARFQSCGTEIGLACAGYAGAVSLPSSSIASLPGSAVAGRRTRVDEEWGVAAPAQAAA